MSWWLHDWLVGAVVIFMLGLIMSTIITLHDTLRSKIVSVLLVALASIAWPICAAILLGMLVVEVIDKAE